MIGIDVHFRSPQSLARTPTSYRRVSVIGSCFAEAWATYLSIRAPCDFILFNNAAELPEQPPEPVEGYDLFILQIPLRSVLTENAYFHLEYNDPASYARLFDDCCDRIDLFLEAGLRWNSSHGALHFVSNFLLPQINPLGRLLPRYDLRNMVHFVSELNRYLGEAVAKRRNCYLLDIDEITASLGRQRVQNDVIYQLNHGAVLADYEPDFDWPRVEPVPAISDMFETRTNEILLAVTIEIDAMYRSVKGIDAVKAVVIDFDDTLWRGVLAEGLPVPPYKRTEGWPLGVAEALLFLKQRGILLAGLSKNDHDFIKDSWEGLFGGKLLMEDFATLKINWQPKPANLGEILTEFNLLASNIVFVDDNPVERAAVQSSFPEIRTLGANPYEIRRSLLWAAETQVPMISQESSARTQMVKRQIAREDVRATMTRDDFLASLDIRVTEHIVRDVDDPYLARAIELINKTNQFNTTGRRWSTAEMEALLTGGGLLKCYSVEDRFTAYGLVVVVVIDSDAVLDQFAMSCRVVGLGIEVAVVAVALEEAQRNALSQLYVRAMPTGRNHLSRQVFEKTGFRETEWGWVFDFDGKPTPEPEHITFVKA